MCQAKYGSRPIVVFMQKIEVNSDMENSWEYLEKKFEPTQVTI